MVNGRIIGNFNRSAKIKGTCTIDKYQENKISFIKNEKYGKFLASLKDAVVLIPEDLIEVVEKHPQNVYIVVKDVLRSLGDIQDFFFRDRFIIEKEGIAQTAKVGNGTRIGTNVYIGENTHIGEGTIIGNGVKILDNSYIFDGVRIGNNTYIYPSVCIYKDCEIGRDCVIHSGAQIGIDGFRFEQDVEQKLVQKIIHVGKVIIRDRVEIGANSTIDRATFEGDATILSDDVKLDDQVHIGHNAKIGARTLIAAQTCISGSVRTGEDVWIGASVTISNGVTIGDRTKVLLNAVVAYDVADDEVISGFYAMPHRQWKRVFKKLKEI